jgi:glyoxylase-like metal-dependent hydrolase (beta-lactamase superfamily II)
MPTKPTLQRLHVGGFRDLEHEAAGQRVVVCSWILRHPDATILVDTGLANRWAELDPEGAATYQFTQTPILDALAAADVARDAVDAVINCHLHADHAGGNAVFRGTPIYAQQAEIAAARGPDYTILQAIDLDEGDYRPLTEPNELLPGVRILPSPGHTPGHQTVAVETGEGLVILAGQSFRLASDFAKALTAMHLKDEGYPNPPAFPDWLPDLMALDPWRVVTAHDRAIWQRDG